MKNIFKKIMTIRNYYASFVIFQIYKNAILRNVHYPSFGWHLWLCFYLEIFLFFLWFFVRCDATKTCRNGTKIYHFSNFGIFLFKRICFRSMLEWNLTKINFPNIRMFTSTMFLHGWNPIFSFIRDQSLIVSGFLPQYMNNQRNWHIIHE